MKTLQLKHGDLVIGTNGYATVDGAMMVAQDLRVALGEPVGNDRFHPGYGSALDSYVGMVLDESARFSVEQEVNRVVGNYTAIQRDRIQKDALVATRSRFSTDDVISEVSAVKVTSSMDAVQVSIGITTMSGKSALISMQAGG